MARNKKPEVLSRGVEDECVLSESLLHHADESRQVRILKKTLAN